MTMIRVYITLFTLGLFAAAVGNFAASLVR